MNTFVHGESHWSQQWWTHMWSTHKDGDFSPAIALDFWILTFRTLWCSACYTAPAVTCNSQGQAAREFYQQPLATYWTDPSGLSFPWQGSVHEHCSEGIPLFSLLLPIMLTSEDCCVKKKKKPSLSSHFQVFIPRTHWFKGAFCAIHEIKQLAAHKASPKTKQ